MTDLSALSRDALAARLENVPVGSSYAFETTAEVCRRLRADAKLEAEEAYLREVLGSCGTVAGLPEDTTAPGLIFEAVCKLAARLAKAEPSEESRAWLMTFCQDQGELRGGERVDALVMAFQHLVRERDELRQVVTTYESTCERYQARIASLESQLAANGKGVEEQIQEGDRVKHRASGVCGVVHENDDGCLHVRTHEAHRPMAFWGEDEVTRLPPEPAVLVTTTLDQLPAGVRWDHLGNVCEDENVAVYQDGRVVASVAGREFEVGFADEKQRKELAPEPAKPVEPAWMPRIGDSVRITRGPFTGKILTVVNIGVMGAIQVDTEGAGFIWTTAFEPPTEAPAIEPAAEGKWVRRSTIEIGVDMLACAKSWDPAVRIIGNVRADEIAHFVQASIEEHDKLQRVLSGVAEIAAEMDRVQLGNGGLQAYVWAEKLRRVCK